MENERQNPEKLLKQVNAEEHQAALGKLKIYFGAAPGVGKTYTMLQDAAEKLAQGLDVVVGIAESHGRSEIEALLKKFEILPRQQVNYREKLLFEFDLDAALKRNPALILVDEMAHSNVPGLRHQKRWQDIKEILDRGIDVYTTLNVQHIESINDDVAQIVGKKIHETIPDSMIEIADTIELVDIPAEDLLKRLQEGKIYFPSQAELAAENFFRKDKLTALRELALRITAERVGAQVLLYREGQGAQTIWTSQEKILVCVGPGTESLKLIRTAKRVATQLHTDWIALYVDAPKLRLSTEKRKRAIENLRLAERLGAETRIITGVDIVKEIMNCAREQSITQIIVGKRIHPRWKNIFLKNLADEIVRLSGEIDVYVVTGPIESQPTEIITQKSPIQWKTYVMATGIVAIASLINFMLFSFLAEANVIMIYLLGVIAVAFLGRMGPSVYASILSVFAYGYFFSENAHRFIISDIQYLFTLFVMLLLAQVISSLTILTRRQAESSYFAEHQASILHTLSRQLASTRGIDKILETSVKYIGDIFHCKVLALRPVNFQLTIFARYQTEKVLDAKEQSVAQWVYELGQKAGKDTDTLSFSEALYLPLIASKRARGVLRIKPIKSDIVFTPEQIRLLESCAHQIALALEADRIEEKDKKLELQIAIEHVRNQLLQDISHDLHVPLVAAMGILNILAESSKIKISEMQARCKESYFELEKLSRLINNFLQITYLENQPVKLEREYFPLKELIDRAVSSISRELQGRELHIDVPETIPNVPVDPALIVDVFRNLLENALKFTLPTTPIEITAHQKENKVIICVIDQGPGIVSDEKDKLFEKFYRGRKITTEAGLGLGLAICRKIIQVHGGHIWAANRDNGGASFCFVLPL